MTVKTPLRAVDLAKELGKDKRTILNWLKSAYEKNEGYFAGLPITKEDWNGNFTYLITPEDWDRFKAVHTREIPENSYEPPSASHLGDPKPYGSAPRPMAEGTDVSQLIAYLHKKDEQMVDMVSRAVSAETQLKLLTDGRSELQRAYDELQQAHYEALARLKQLESELAALKSPSANDDREDRPRQFWKFWG
jgi:hypothetical protein